MKITAIRLREVGPFRDGVAVEGLSGGLDVLAGPNELGKSTLLRALSQLFLAKHTAAGRDIERLRPYGGGSPLIEADFEAGGHRWRLRKQFLSGRTAVLTNLDSGRVTARGPDAHAQALAVIGLEPDQPGPLGLLWVGQQAGLKPLAPSRTEKELLLASIGAEVATITSGHTLRAIAERVETELAVLLKPKQRTPRGDYQLALARRDQLIADREAALAQAHAVEGRMTQLEALQGQRAQLTDPAAASQAGEALTRLLAAVEAGRRARTQHQMATAARKAAESQCARLVSEIKALRTRLAELARLTAATAASAPRIEAAQAGASAAALVAEAAAAERTAIETALTKAQDQLRRREQAEAHAALSRRLGEADAAAADEARLAREVAQIAATATRLAEAETAQRGIDAEQAALDGAAPRIAIAYEPGVLNAIAADGAPLADGVELRPTAPLVLEIAGIGRITVTPVGGDLAATRVRLDRHRRTLTAALTAMGVPDLDAARAGAARRRDLETARQIAAGRLEAAAPEGLETLRQTCTVAAAAATSTSTSTSLGDAVDPDALVTLPPRSALATRLTELEQAYRAGAHRAETTAAEAHRQARMLATLLATDQAMRTQLTAINDELAQGLGDAGDPGMPGSDSDDPGSGGPQARLAGLEAEFSAATAVVHAAVREVAAWAETAPSDTAWPELQGTLARQQQALVGHTQKLAQVEQAIARIEGELEAASETDVAARIDEMQGALAATQTRIDRCRREVEALLLLESMIAEELNGAQDRFLAPVLRRIEPYLQLVLPQARLQLSDGLAATGLVRGQAVEAAATLSDGTQEQLAVLTRLGFGRMLAERGRPAPVILDDALVYSDDTRIDGLFEALRQASAYHQVLVLTCRARAFQALGGTQLGLRPWKAD